MTFHVGNVFSWLSKTSQVLFSITFLTQLSLKKKFFHPGILALGRLRQENGFEFEVSLGFIESSRIALVAKHDPASENQKKYDMTLKTNV